MNRFKTINKIQNNKKINKCNRIIPFNNYNKNIKIYKMTKKYQNKIV